MVRLWCLSAPHENNELILGFRSFFSYTPWFQHIFLTRGISAEFFFLPMA
jgi:hypothetical protein